MGASNRIAERAATNYQRQEILSESPTALVARLYDMAGLEVARAQAAAAQGEWAVKGKAVHRASLCISQLQCTLNLEEGGEVARNLDRLYDYLNRRLTEAHLTNDGAIFGEVAQHLSELGAAWRDVARRTGTAEGTRRQAEARVPEAVAP